MLNKIKSRLLSGKIVTLFMALLLLFSCGKKAPSIAWEKNKSFAEILNSANDKYVMIDFYKDG